jgi:hypothetical protein
VRLSPGPPVREPERLEDDDDTLCVEYVINLGSSNSSESRSTSLPSMMATLEEEDGAPDNDFIGGDIPCSRVLSHRTVFYALQMDMTIRCWTPQKRNLQLVNKEMRFEEGITNVDVIMSSCHRTMKLAILFVASFLNRGDQALLSLFIERL